MLPFILLPLLWAHIRRHPLRPLLKAWDLLPLLAIELIHVFFQISCFAGNTRWIGLGRYLQWALLLSLLVPILRRRLYKPALWGAGCTIVGSLLNRVVMAANGGQMPVWPTLSQWTGYCTRETLSLGLDKVHILMTEGARLTFLGDYIDLGWCILSPGDVLNHLFVSIIVYYTVLSFERTEK
ncbi:MAG: DUF5317 domain-containing protein [Clostridiales bacterium]|nr:DUF5317 domain-containing protein [Clostridiales bacterium]